MVAHKLPSTSYNVYAVLRHTENGVITLLLSTGEEEDGRERERELECSTIVSVLSMHSPNALPMHFASTLSMPPAWRVQCSYQNSSHSGLFSMLPNSRARLTLSAYAAYRRIFS